MQSEPEGEGAGGQKDLVIGTAITWGDKGGRGYQEASSARTALAERPRKCWKPSEACNPRLGLAMRRRGVDSHCSATTTIWCNIICSLFTQTQSNRVLQQ